MDEQRMSQWRWGLYAGCIVDGIFIPMVGGILDKTGGPWAVMLIALYIMWATMFGIFLWTFFERSGTFIIRCLYYLICSLLPFAFFGSFGSNVQVQFWLPLSLTLGIVVGCGISECCAFLSPRRLRLLILRCLMAEDTPLPQYADSPVYYYSHHPRTTGAQTTTASEEGSIILDDEASSIRPPTAPVPRPLHTFDAYFPGTNNEAV